ncbi:MAG: hypothetical protein RLO80_00255 [Hyphomonas sp.]
MIGLSALMAMVFAALLAAGEVIRNWGHWQPWPFWIIDFIAAGALLWGGYRTIRQGSSRMLSAAWGLTVGIFWMSFFSHSDAWNKGAPGSGSPEESRLILVIGVMLLVAIIGLILSLTRRKL